MAIMDDLTANMDQQITLAFTSELQRLSLENQLKVQGFNVNTAISQPRSSMYGNRFGSLDPRRDINDECGFPLTEQITIQDLKYYWERESIANRVVNILPRESWRVTPRVYETEDKDTNTEFEKALDELPSELSGHSWLGSQEDNEGNPLWATLARLDELCGIGTFGLLLIGIDDGKELSEPIEGIDKNGDRVGKSGKRYKLTYLRVFDESAITITSYEDDKNCRRYKQPLTYEIDLGASVTSKQQTQHSKEGSVSVHWTRVIHVADNVVSSNLFGVPRMIPVINNLMNLRKLYGGDAEIWWKNASRSMILETHPQLGGKVKYNSATMKAELEKFNSGLQRDLITTGFNAKTLAPSAVDPSSHIDIQIDAICVQLETPKRIFLGSERGELASTQDADAWENRLKGRRNRHVTPRVTGPVINRFILIGVLPQPGEVFYIAWDPLEFMTPLEKAQIFSARMDGITKYIGGEAFSIISPLSILVRELGYTKEEALEELQAAEDAMEEADPPLAPKAQQQGENPFGGEAPSGEGGFDDTGVGEGMVPDERAGSTKSKRARFPYDRGKKLIEHHGVENHPGHPDQKVHGNRPGGKRGRGKDTRKSHGNWAHDGGEDSNGVKPYKSNVETYIEGTTKSTYTPVEGRGEFSAYIEQVMNYRAMSMIQKSSHYGSLVKGCNQSALYDELMKSNLGEFSFFDDRGKVGITNRGHAKAIFRDTIREFIEHVKYGKTDAVAFIGLEKSRRKFYKFLSSRASKYAPGWKGYQLGPGLFVVAKEEGHNWNKYFDNPLSVNALLVEHHHPGGEPHDQEKHGDWADDLEPKKKLSGKEERELKKLEEWEARRKARKERAKRGYKKSTKAKQDRGENEQRRMSKIIDGVNDDDNKPFDVIAGRHGIEVKTVIDNKNNKITVHPESRRRKELTAKKYGLDMHTIVIDVRGGRRKYYYKAGVGAYRLSAMERVSTREIKELFEER